MNELQAPFLWVRLDEEENAVKCVLFDDSRVPMRCEGLPKRGSQGYCQGLPTGAAKATVTKRNGWGLGLAAPPGPLTPVRGCALLPPLAR